MTVTTVVIAGLSIPLGWTATQSPWAPVASYFGLLGALAVLYAGWLPRIVARRLEAELREDPSAAVRHRRDRRISRARLHPRRGERRARPARRSRRDLALSGVERPEPADSQSGASSPRLNVVIRPLR